MSGNSTDEPSAKLFDPTFINFTRRILSVPHSEIKAKLDAEKEAKRIAKASTSRVLASSSKAR
jgi:hypothetical protein